MNTARFVLAMVLLCLASAHPASAFTFTLVSDGAGQHLNWLWEYYPPTSSCLIPFYTCGDRSSVNGDIDLVVSSNSRTRSGGMLSRASSSGSLKVVAMPVAIYMGSNITGEWGRVWAAIDAEAQPLVFSIVAEPGDPFPLVVDLQVHPKIVGTINQYASPGTQADIDLQLKMAVAVDGQFVSRDSLFASFPSTGQFVTLSPAFPKGAANSLVVPGVVEGSEVAITLWAYMNVFVSGFASVLSNSDYGMGPAIEVKVRSTEAVDVPVESDPAGLMVATRPNPTRGDTHIEYLLARGSEVRLSVYGITGSRVATLVDGVDAAGRHEVRWNGRDTRGERLAPGIYLVELLTPAERSVGKLVLLGR